MWWCGSLNIVVGHQRSMGIDAKKKLDTHEEREENKAQRWLANLKAIGAVYICARDTSQMYYKIISAVNKSEAVITKAGGPHGDHHRRRRKQGIWDDNNEGGVISSNKVYHTHSLRGEYKARETRDVWKQLEIWMESVNDSRKERRRQHSWSN